MATRIANPYSTSTSSGSVRSPFTPTATPEKKKSNHFGIVGNFVSDVKDAVVGLPQGIRMMFDAPVESLKLMGQSTWQTWSPLFNGQFGKFVKQTYDHPLAPMLDALTVFSLGAGSAAKGAGLLEKAGVKSTALGKAANLQRPRALTLVDPTGKGRPTLERNLSTRAGRRLFQEMSLRMDAHTPQWYVGVKKRARYEGAHYRDIAGRVAAKQAIIVNALRAGEHLSGPDGAKGRAEIAAHSYMTLVRYSHRKAPELKTTKKGHVVDATTPGDGYRFIKKAELIDPRDLTEYRAITRRLAQIDKKRAKLSDEAQRIRRVPEELENLSYDPFLKGSYAESGRVQARLKSQQTRSKAVERHDDLIKEMEALQNRRVDIESRHYKEFFERIADDPATWEEFMAQSFGRRVTTSKLHQAARDAKGNYLVVPVHDAAAMGLEAATSHGFVRWIWHVPTRLWKIALLGYTPRIVTNNAIGNWFLYAARELGQPGSAAALHDAMRLLYGNDKAAKLGMTAFKKNNWLHRWFSDEMGNVFARELSQGGKASRAAQGFYPIVHATSDAPVRAATIASYLRRDPSVRALMKQGNSFDRSVELALRRDRRIRDRAANHARTVAGDYQAMRPWERHIRSLVPFYLWDRHILKSTGNMVLDTPGRAAFLQKLSNEGVESTEEFLGRLPEFLRGALPLGIGRDGRANVILTHSLNPFATLGELASAGEAATTGGGVRPGASLLGQMHPYLSGAAEWVTGQNILTGAKKEQRGGILTAVLSNMALNLPQVRFAEDLISGSTSTSPSGKPLLFKHGWKASGSSLTGIPVRSVSLEQALEIARREQGEKKPPKERKKKTGVKSPYG